MAEREGQLDDLAEARRLLGADALEDAKEALADAHEMLTGHRAIAYCECSVASAFRNTKEARNRARDFLARVGDPASPQERHRRSEEASRYNGWRTYETWAVALWIDNDEGGQSEANEKARAAWRDAEADAPFTRREMATFALADTLKEWFEEEREEGGWAPNGFWQNTGPYTDLTRAALQSVEWQEVAEHYLSDDLVGELEAEEEEEDDDDEEEEEGDDA